MDYSNFETEDFASDDYFIRWVLDDDREASLFWETYKLNHPEADLKIDNACALLLNIRRVEQTLHTPAEIEKTWVNIQSRISMSAPRASFSLLRIAATVSAVILLSLVWYVSNREGDVVKSDHVAQVSGSDAHDLIEEINTTGAIMRIYLSDGSIVSLQSESRLKYYKDYDNKMAREVYLTGEAFFDIARNGKQPFFVYANEVVTKVLGTSFHVKAYDDEKDVVVSVKEGKVSVYSEKNLTQKSNIIKSEVNGVVLMPNQRVLYKRDDDSFNKTLIEKPAIIKASAFKDGFGFKNAPVKEVFRVLEEAYGVEMIFDEDVLQDCFLTAPLGSEPLFEKLKIICRTIGARYELIDAKVVISSKGCGEKTVE